MSKIYIVIYALLKINPFKLFTLHSVNSKNVVWVFKSFKIKSLFNNNYLNDLALIHSFLDLGVDFKLKFGRNLKGLANKNIFYNISKELNFANLNDHNIILHSIICSLEDQGNLCFPSSRELRYWENKKYMHTMFEVNKINSPKTFFSCFLQNENILSSLNNFPYLVKESHSAGGAGIFLVNNIEEYLRISKSLNSKGVYDFLVQKRVEMRRDLRIIVVGNEVVLHYWRINTSDEWKITSTKEGSQVDFEFLPDGIIEKALYYTKLLDLRSAAFDITFENDDFNSEPIILEVSPAFMPNPKQKFGIGNISYDKYKKFIFTVPNYSMDYVNLVFSLKIKLLQVQYTNIE